MDNVDELKICIGSKVSEVKDYVLYHKYMSSDFGYGKTAEHLLMEADIILDALQDDDIAPQTLVERLIRVFGDAYGWA